MTGIDDLVDRLRTGDSTVVISLSALDIVRQWAGEQADKDTELRSAVERLAYRNHNLYGADVRADLRDILNRTSSLQKLDPDTGAALAGIKELQAEFGPTNYDDPTPQPVAGDKMKAWEQRQVIISIISGNDYTERKADAIIALFASAAPDALQREAARIGEDACSCLCMEWARQGDQKAVQYWRDRCQQIRDAGPVPGNGRQQDEQYLVRQANEYEARK
jgi:hypothetical protein